MDLGQAQQFTNKNLNFIKFILRLRKIYIQNYKNGIKQKKYIYIYLKKKKIVKRDN